MSGSEQAFLAIGAIGFLLLLCSFVLGGIFDHEWEFSHEIEFDHEAGVGEHDVAHSENSTPSWLSMKVISASMVGFGAFGFAAAYYGVPSFIAWPLAAVGFFSVGAGTFYLVIVPLADQQSNTLVSQEEYIRCTGTLSLPISVDQPGQVVFHDPTGNRVVLRATSLYSSPIAKGAPVLIVDMKGNDAVVTPFPAQDLEI